MDTSLQAVVLFDGVCNLCNSSVNFILDHESGRQLKFASLQSETAKALLKPFGFPVEDLSTIVFLWNGTLYTKSGAVLRISRFLRFPWNLVCVFLIVPPFLRNLAYRIIAANRYRWFGEREQCRMPEPGVRDRFLE